jgi:hypothetical protein
MKLSGKSLRRSLGFSAAAFLLAGSVFAQPAGGTVMGNLVTTLTSGAGTEAVTAIDLASPANLGGSIFSATVRIGPRCAPRIKIKFFRPVGSTLVFLGERGPFVLAQTTQPQTVQLNPAFTVQAGDLIGLSSLDSCGYVVYLTPGADPGVIFVFGTDVVGNIPRTSGERGTLPVFGQGQPSEAVVGMMAVVVSAPGVPPSLFKTGLQVHNPTAAVMAGRLVYRRNGASGSDPSIAFLLAPGQTGSVEDLLPAMGLSGSQIGSLDIVMPTSSLPLLAARIYNEGGAAGTTGFTIGSISDEAVLTSGDHGALVLPSDTSRFRTNIGVRTGAAGVSLTVTRRNAGGGVVQTLSKTYPGTYFEQVPASAFLGGAAVEPNDSLTIQITAGSATLYAVSADNTSQDPSIQFATKTP